MRNTLGTILLAVCVSLAAGSVGADQTGDESAAFQAALDAGGPLRISAGLHTMRAGLTISRDDTEVECQPGAILRSAGYSGTLLAIRNSAGVAVRGCAIDGAGAGLNGNALVEADNARELVFTGNAIGGTVAGMYGILLVNVANARIAGNRLEAIQGPGISVAEGSFDIAIEDNTVDAAASTNGRLSGSAIEVKARAASGQDLRRVTIARNTIRIATGFCVEAGQFGGAGTVGQVWISGGNRCQVVSIPGAEAHCGSEDLPKTCGGYSLASASDSRIVGNSYDAAGQAVDIAGIEMVECLRCVASANVLVDDTSATASGSSGISANCSGCTISGNQLTHLGPVVANALIDVHTIPTFRGVDGNSITGNTLTLPSGGLGIKGIYVHCDHAGGSASGTLIAGNTILGAAGAGQGIVLAAEGPGCALADSQVVANTMSNLATGLLVYRASQIVYMLNRLTSTATPVADNGGSSFGARVF
jgi:hypothetical protein